MKYEIEDQEFDYSPVPTKRQKKMMKQRKKVRNWKRHNGVDVGSTDGDFSVITEFKDGKIIKQEIRR